MEEIFFVIIVLISMWGMTYELTIIDKLRVNLVIPYLVLYNIGVCGLIISK